MKYEFIDHTADIKFRSYGNTLDESFENAAYALKEIISKDINKTIQSTI